MLVLQRDINEVVVINVPGWPPIRVTHIAVRGGKVRLGFQAPAEVTIRRLEIHDRITREGELR